MIVMSDDNRSQQFLILEVGWFAEAAFSLPVRIVGGITDIQS